MSDSFPFYIPPPENPLHLLHPILCSLQQQQVSDCKRCFRGPCCPSVRGQSFVKKKKKKKKKKPQRCKCDIPVRADSFAATYCFFFFN